MCTYELEKIHSYLNGKRTPFLSPNQSWGLTQANDFAKQFAKKWVKFDVKNMMFDEIILLTDTACYLEAQEQKKLLKKINNKGGAGTQRSNF